MRIWLGVFVFLCLIKIVGCQAADDRPRAAAQPAVEQSAPAG